jgi:hypothetical protein
MVGGGRMAIRPKPFQNRDITAGCFPQSHLILFENAAGFEACGIFFREPFALLRVPLELLSCLLMQTSAFFCKIMFTYRVGVK